MRLIERVEAGSDGEKRDGDNDRHHAVREDSARCRLLVFRRQIALNDGLVARVGNQVVGQSAENDDPERGRAMVERPVEKPELIVGRGDLEEVGSTVARVENQVSGGQKRASHVVFALFMV